jgi:uncharacterized membrane protein
MSEVIVRIECYCDESDAQDLKEYMEECCDMTSQIVSFSKHIQIIKENFGEKIMGKILLIILYLIIIGIILLGLLGFIGGIICNIQNSIVPGFSLIILGVILGFIALFLDKYLKE